MILRDAPKSSMAFSKLVLPIEHCIVKRFRPLHFEGIFLCKIEDTLSPIFIISSPFSLC